MQYRAIQLLLSTSATTEYSNRSSQIPTITAQLRIPARPQQRRATQPPCRSSESGWGRGRIPERDRPSTLSLTRVPYNTCLARSRMVAFQGATTTKRGAMALVT